MKVSGERLLQILNQLLVALSITLLSLVVMDALLPGFALSNIRSAILGILVLGVLNYVILPLAIRFTLPLDFLTLGMLPLVLNGLAVLLVSRLVPGFEVHNVGTGILISFGLTFNNLLISSSYVFRKQRHRLEYAMLSRLADKSDGTGDSKTPGLILLEIDGLAEPLLRQAIERGAMPTLAAWLRSGTHRLIRWESSLPSQTSSMQAGILHGRHHNIPGFRFYDRQRKQLLSSNNPAVAGDILRPNLNGQGILHENGYGLNNWATGDAPEVLLTFSAMQKDVLKQSHYLYAFFARAYNVQRVLLDMLWDILVELWEAQQQRAHNVQPRIDRRFPYPVIRAATTQLLPTLSRQLLVTKLFEGIDASYTTFLNYDEVAHHSGIDRPDVFRALRQLDEQIGFITGAAALTDRPYEFVVLSDHGQSMGATFRQRYGKTLAELVESIVDQGSTSLSASSPSAEGIDYLGLLFSQLLSLGTWSAGILNRLLRGRISEEGQVDFRQRRTPPKAKGSDKPAKAVVAASGNLANIYLTDYDEALSAEKLQAVCPELMKALLTHPGISFAAVRTEHFGSMVLSKNGRYYLESGKVEGENPLQNFGDHAPVYLKELMTYPNSGDVVVNSLYDPQTGEVAAFEELVGSHGGLGGTQLQPFLLYPTALGTVDPGSLAGSPAIYGLLGQWLKKLKTEGYQATHLPTPDPDIASGKRPRSVDLLAVLVGIIATWNFLVSAGGLIASRSELGRNAESFSHFVIPFLAAVFAVLIGIGLWRLKRWALQAAIAMMAISVILSILDLMFAPPQSRGLSGILASVPIINAILFFYLLYSPRVRRAFG